MIFVEDIPEDAANDSRWLVLRINGEVNHAIYTKRYGLHYDDNFIDATVYDTSGIENPSVGFVKITADASTVGISCTNLDAVNTECE